MIPRRLPSLARLTWVAAGPLFTIHPQGFVEKKNLEH